MARLFQSRQGVAGDLFVVHNCVDEVRQQLHKQYRVGVGDLAVVTFLHVFRDGEGQRDGNTGTAQFAPGQSRTLVPNGDLVAGHQPERDRRVARKLVQNGS